MNRVQETLELEREANKQAIVDRDTFFNGLLNLARKLQQVVETTLGDQSRALQVIASSKSHFDQLKAQTGDTVAE